MDHVYLFLRAEVPRQGQIRATKVASGQCRIPNERDAGIRLALLRRPGGVPYIRYDRTAVKQRKEDKRNKRERERESEIRNGNDARASAKVRRRSGRVKEDIESI